MSGDLTFQGDQLPMIAADDDAKLDKLAGTGFLPFIQLVGSSSNLAKTGKARVGIYVLSRAKDKYEDLTSSFEALVVSRRAKACRKTNKGFFNFFDQDSAEYKKVEEEAKSGGMSGSWHGTEYLCWLPSFKEWCTYHASNPTARTAAGDMNTILKDWRKELVAAAEARAAKAEIIPTVRNPQVKFTCALVTYSNGNQQWGPSMCRATTPFSNMPDPQDVLDRCSKFATPPKNKVQVQETAADSEEMG